MGIEDWAERAREAVREVVRACVPEGVEVVAYCSPATFRDVGALAVDVGARVVPLRPDPSITDPEEVVVRKVRDRAAGA